jgi:CubicO group peptidase (beta-lactamase class C family)
MKTKSLIFLLLVFTLLNVSAGQINKSKPDSLFQTLKTNDKFMGSIAISHNGEIIYSNAIGYADMESGIEATTATKYRIGSISKMFTSVLVFRAIEENKLSLDFTLDKYIPQIDNAANITISDMLYHRSGIHSITNDADYLSWNTQQLSKEQMIEKIAKSKSEFEPDSKSEYSNSNYILLGYILEAVYNMPYNKILLEKIINPIGLSNTYYGSKTETNNNECYSYKSVAKWEKESETDMSVPGGAGAIVSNPADLTKFIESLFEGKLITEESLTQMTAINGQFGRGIFQIPFYETVGWGHTGAIDAFYSVVAYFPQDSLSIAICSNGTKYDINNITIGALSWFYNKPYDIPVFSSLVLNAEELQAYLGVYSCEQIPIKITVSAEGNVLIAQGEGQNPFALEPVGKNIFKFDMAGIVMEFKPEVNQMILKQGGGEFTFKKN